MSTFHEHLSRCLAAAFVIAAGALLHMAVAPGSAAAQAPAADRTARAAALPRVADLPSDFQPVGDIAGRGTFHAGGGQRTYRKDDGSHYHGYAGPGVWAQEPKGTRTDGVVYGVEGGHVVSAGYILRQADLTAGRSFHGLTLRALDFPAAHAFTTDFLPDETSGDHRFLMLWHFRPPAGQRPEMLPHGQLPLLTSLPQRFSVYACDQYPDLFCPGMGRHYTDLSKSPWRLPRSPGDDGVIYGEAAGKLIFIEYVLGQRELAEGVSWPEMPLYHLPIPPIDNAHVLHFGRAGSLSGRYTVHMYFLPEETYLAWETEPPQL